MVQHSTCARTLPQAKPASMTASCFQPQDSADKNLRKSLKNNDLSSPPPPQFSAGRLRSCPPPQGPDDRRAAVRRFIRCRKGRGLSGSICAAPYALAGARRLQRCGLSAPAYQGSPLFNRGTGSKGRARRLCLAPTIQAEGEAFQGGALDYAVSKKRSSYSAYAAEKGRFQPPYVAGKPGSEVAPAESRGYMRWPQQGGSLKDAAGDAL